MARFFKFPIELNKYNFTELYCKCNNTKLKIRYLGLSYLQSGKSLTESAELLHKSTRSLQQWVSKILSNGLEELQDKPKSGRHNKLKLTEYDAFKKEVLDMQSKKTGGRVIAKDIRQMLEDKFGTKYSLPGVYVLLEKACLVWITGRSAHPKRDQNIQDEFKKNSLKK